MDEIKGLAEKEAVAMRGKLGSVRKSKAKVLAEWKKDGKWFDKAKAKGVLEESRGLGAERLKATTKKAT